MSQAGIVDIEGTHPQIPTLFVCNIGEAIPIANTLEILAEAVVAQNIPIETVGSGNTVSIQLQYTSSASSSVATNAGIASFNSTDFTVDANGFVSANATGIQTIDGDTGSITGTTVTIKAGVSTQNCGATVSFVNSGTISTLNVTDSNKNTAIGLSAGTSGVGISANSSLGYLSLASLASGIRNTAIGFASLDNSASGSYNIGIGEQAGSGYTGNESSNIVISNSGTTGENNVIRIGTQGTGNGQQNICYIAGITGATPTSADTPQVMLCDNTGNLTVISSSTAGYVLTSNGSATPSFQAASGGSGITTIDGDTGSVTGSTISLTGQPQAGSSITFSGSGTSMSFNTTDANDNVLVGLNCGNSSLVGLGAAGNCGLGINCLNALTTGVDNTAMGQFASSALTNGVGNTSFGSAALGNQTEGGQNTAIGAGSLQGLLTGQYNTALGVNSGSNYAAAEGSNISIANPGIASESHVIRIGVQGSSDSEQDTCFIAGITGATPTSANTPQVVLCDNTGNLTAISSSTSGHVLTSNGSATPSFQAASVGITTINGDSGSATGSTITFNANSNAGASVKFVASGSTVLLEDTDTNQNIFFGAGAGNTSLSGTYNCGFGSGASPALTTGFFNFAIGGFSLNACTTGAENTGVGVNSLRDLISGNGNLALGTSTLNQLTSGSSNIALGLGAGTNYTGAETNNILLNHGGVLGESSTTHIGTSGTQTACYIAGIEGASYSAGSPTPTFTYIDTSNGQLVGNATTASATVTTNFGSLVVGTGRQNTANYAILVNVSIVVTAATGATITLGVGSTSTPTTSTVVTTFSAAATTTYSFSAIVPSQYYMLVNTTGTITVGSITTQACGM